MKEFRITDETSGQRLNKVLLKLLPEAGSSFLYRMLRKKNITVNDKKADGAQILQNGDTIRIWFSDDTYRKFAAGSREISGGSSKPSHHASDPDVLYEDDDLLFVSKPAGLLIQPDSKTSACLTAQVSDYLFRQKKSDTSGIFRVGPANRLDRNTSGVVAFGKTIRGQQYLAEQFRERSMKKYYLALVKGNIPGCAGEEVLTGWYRKDRESNVAHLYTEKNKPASALEVQLGISALAGSHEAALLKVHLLTGKSHQIRVQLSGAGHPLAGDPKYGDAAWNNKLARLYGLKRQFLHAYQLELAGLDGQPLTISAPLPEDLKRVLKGEKLWVPGIPED